jgi:hypothetical protein
MPYVVSASLPCWGPPDAGGAATRGTRSWFGRKVHDFFTGVEIISYEDFSFAERLGASELYEAEDRVSPTAVFAVTFLEGPIVHG